MMTPAAAMTMPYCHLAEFPVVGNDDRPGRLGPPVVNGTNGAGDVA